MDNKITGDDEKLIDVVKRQPIKVVIPFLDSVDGYFKLRTFDDAIISLIDELMADYNTDSKYKNSTVSNYDFDKTNLTIDKFRNKIVDFIDNSLFDNKASSMILCGKESFGCGKTHLINAFAKQWYQTPKVELKTNQYGEVTVTYVGVGYKVVREEDLILRILATYKKEPKECETDIYNQLSKYDILAIDDIGKYAPTNLEFYRRVMFQIIDSRYNKGQGIVLSTNFGLTELTKFFGVAISDRLNEMTKGFQIEIKGVSNRVK
jgi:DNA replication protein DnaC